MDKFTFNRADARTRSIQVQIENLTSGLQKVDQNATFLEEIHDEALTLTLVGPAASCASGHHLKVQISVVESTGTVKFTASGVAREVERSEGGGLRILYQPVQFDRGDWKILLEAFARTFHETQKLFTSMKE